MVDLGNHQDTNQTDGRWVSADLNDALAISLRVYCEQKYSQHGDIW